MDVPFVSWRVRLCSRSSSYLTLCIAHDYAYVCCIVGSDRRGANEHGMEFSFYMIMLLKYKLYKYQTWPYIKYIVPGLPINGCGRELW